MNQNSNQKTDMKLESKDQLIPALPSVHAKTVDIEKWVHKVQNIFSNSKSAVLGKQRILDRETNISQWILEHYPPSLQTAENRFLAGLFPDSTGLYGPPGWTESCLITQLIKPFFLAENTIGQGYHRFAGIDSYLAQLLSSLLVLPNLNDRQNQAPTLGDLLTATAKTNGKMFLEGYLIDRSRYDERISVDTVYWLELEPENSWWTETDPLQRKNRCFQWWEGVLAQWEIKDNAIPDSLELIIGPDLNQQFLPPLKDTTWWETVPFTRKNLSLSLDSNHQYYWRLWWD